MRYFVPQPDDVIEARRALHSVAVRTPVVRSDALDAVTGGRVFIKCENLQRSGAFKFRGAYNCLSRLDIDAFPDGVVAYSTGNHGLAIASVGGLLDIPTRIVMPSDAPAVKIAKARSKGAEVLLYDRFTESREEIAERISKQARIAVIPPGDNPYIIAGQGTAAAEALEEVGPQQIDSIYLPCGGGGLAAGTVLAAKATGSNAEIWAVEPLDFDDTARSLLSGEREKNPRVSGSICDALLAPMPAELPWLINSKHLKGAVGVSDAEVLAAMRFAFDELRLVLEPGGSVGLAKVLSEPSRFRDRSTLVIASGGNVDIETFRQALSQKSQAASRRIFFQRQK